MCEGLTKRDLMALEVILDAGCLMLDKIRTYYMHLVSSI